MNSSVGKFCCYHAFEESQPPPARLAALLAPPISNDNAYTFSLSVYTQSYSRLLSPRRDDHAIERDSILRCKDFDDYSQQPTRQ